MKGISSIMCFLLIALSVQAKAIHLKQNTNLNQVLRNSYTTFIVDESLDLHGTSIVLPFRSTLSFTTNGSINNGQIIGNSSLIKAGTSQIFNNIKIGGSWRNTKVYSQWFKFKGGQENNNDVFAQLMQLCGGNQLTHFYMQKGTYYVSAIYRSAPILIPSNVYWHNEATIKMLPTDLEWYNIVYLNKSNNVTIDGGSFIGDVENHKGKTGEWGHGIKCGGATNVIIKNVICSHFWGDGIDLIEGLDENKKPIYNCNNITINNVKCLNNRRQGMSIEAASNVRIINSEFAYTGLPKYTLPGAGLDIEPWTNNQDKVWNVSVVNCTFHDNEGLDVQCEPNIKKLASFAVLKNNITFSKCNIGSMRIQYTKDIVLKNCNVSKNLLIQWTDGVVVRKSKIEKFKKGNKSSNVKMQNCEIKTKPSIVAYAIPLVGFSAFALVGFTKSKEK